jgi:hypothetical protein
MSTDFITFYLPNDGSVLMSSSNNILRINEIPAIHSTKLFRIRIWKTFFSCLHHCVECVSRKFITEACYTYHAARLTPPTQTNTHKAHVILFLVYFSL